MMTIIYISSEYPPLTANGGIGTYTKYSAEGMCNRGHTVYVICRNTDPAPVRHIVNGVHIHQIPPSEFILPKAPSLYYLRVILRALFYHTLVRISWACAVGDELALISKSEPNIDIIEYPECGAEGLCIPKTIKACKIVRLHTPWSLVKKLDQIKEHAGDELLFPFLEKYAVKKAHAITAPSHAILDNIAWRPPNSPPTVIPNPIKVKKLEKTQRSGWIYTGRVEKRKGVHVLLTAYKQICTTHSAPHLTIVGVPFGVSDTGCLYESVIQQLIDSSGCHSKITWLKGIPLEQVYALLQQSSVAFFPSLWENFPYSCLEAMAFGCAVVASNCGGFPEMVSHNKHGFLLPPSSPKDLISAMRVLIQNPDLVEKFGRAAAAHVATNFDSELICAKMESFYLSKAGLQAHGK